MPDDDVLPAVVSLLARYCATIDHRESAAWSELFTVDGRFELPSTTIAGREALSAYAAASPRGVHVAGLPDVAAVPEGWSAVCSWTFVNADTGAVIAGYYADLIVADGTALRFARRRVEISPLQAS